MAKADKPTVTGPPIPSAPGPPRSGLPWIEILRPTWEKPLEATILSLRWACFRIHWLHEKQRTFPCTGPGCKLCKEIGSHWYAWAVAVLHGRKRLCLIEVPEKGWVWGPQALCDEEAVIRGQGIRLERKNKSRCAGVIVKSIPPEFSTSVLPPPMEAKPLLLRLWNYVENPSIRVPADPPSPSDESHHAHGSR